MTLTAVDETTAASVELPFSLLLEVGFRIPE